MLPYYAALLISAIGVAASPVLVKLSEVDATATLWLRMGVASILLFLPLGSLRATPRPAADEPATVPSPRRLTLGILLTGLLFCADMLANHWAMKLTSVANTSLLMNLTPVFVVVIASLFLGERQTVLSMTGVILAILGAIVLVGESYSLGREQLIGDALALCSSLIYATYMVLTKILRTWVPAARLLKWHTGLSFLLLFPLVLGSTGPMTPPTLHGWLIIICLATVSQVIGHGLMTFAMKQVSAGISSMSTLVIPVFSALLGWMVLAEAIQLYHLLGGALVLGGIGLYVMHDLQASKS